MIKAIFGSRKESDQLKKSSSTTLQFKLLGRNSASKTNDDYKRLELAIVGVHRV
ncbi:hypothetical protein SSUD12_1780 [Streptococcus suis D12]|uniref:Uncharacterized protein n=1 Tax=Streptococcus suis D12 TaxID=1004952 RepID=G7SHN8_STRSU|nr:hypothetical protein SSUD12_1780 [Streptococcus suis D12]